jgi:hypothetical protein
MAADHPGNKVMAAAGAWDAMGNSNSREAFFSSADPVTGRREG